MQTEMKVGVWKLMGEGHLEFPGHPFPDSLQKAGNPEFPRAFADAMVLRPLVLWKGEFLLFQAWSVAICHISLRRRCKCPSHLPGHGVGP